MDEKMVAALIVVWVPVVVAAVKHYAPNIPKPLLPTIGVALGGTAGLLIEWAGQPGMSPGVGMVLGAAGVGLREVLDQAKKAAQP